MKFTFHVSPSIKNNLSTQRIMKELSLSLLVSSSDKEVSLRLDEKQRRIDEALNASVNPKEITQYENVISYLDGLDDDTINSEESEGTTLRENLIYQDFINRGFSEDQRGAPAVFGRPGRAPDDRRGEQDRSPAPGQRQSREAADVRDAAGLRVL